MSFLRLSSFAALIACAACSTTPETTLSGTVDTSTFPGAVTSLTAIDSAGVVSSVALASDGSFTLALPAGETYSLSLDVDGAPVPIAARRISATDPSAGYGSLFAVATDGASVDLGELRFVSLIKTQSLTVGSDNIVDVEETCDAGVGSVSGDACIGAEAPVVCADAGMGHGDGDGHHGRGHHGHHHDGGMGDDAATTPVIDVPLADLRAVVLPSEAIPLSLACGMVGC